MTLSDDAIASNLEDVPANKFKMDLGLAARAALRKVQQEIAMKEVEQRLRSELKLRSCARNWIPWRRP